MPKSLSYPLRKDGDGSPSVLLLNHRPHRVRTPRLQFAPSVFWRFYIDRSSSFRQSIQLLGAMVVCERPSRIGTKSVTMDCGRYHGGIYNPRFGNSLCTLRAIVPPSVVEMYVYSRYCLAAGGLHRISSPGFTSGRSVLSLPRAVGE